MSCLRSFANPLIPSLHAVVFASLVLVISAPALADAAADAIINKGIKALGGEVRLIKARATTNKVKISDDNGVSKIEHTTDGLDRTRVTFEGNVGREKFTVVTVIDGDKGWIKEGEMEARELQGEELASQKWGHLWGVTTITLVPLKRKDLKFKTEAVSDVKVSGKPAAGVKVTAPDGSYRTIYFDKESGLLVKEVDDFSDLASPSQKLIMENYHSDYKDFGGIKRATKHELKRDGKTFSKVDLLDFKVLDKVDDKMFAKPE